MGKFNWLLEKELVDANNICSKWIVGDDIMSNRFVRIMKMQKENYL